MTERAYYTINDFAREFSPYNTLLFAAKPGESPLHPVMKEAYGHLYAFIKNHMTVHEFQEEPVRLARIEDTRQRILAFAKIASKVSHVDSRLAEAVCIPEVVPQLMLRLVSK